MAVALPGLAVAGHLSCRTLSHRRPPLLRDAPSGLNSAAAVARSPALAVIRHLRLFAPAWWEYMQIITVLLKGTEVQTKFDNEDELQQVDANLARVDGVYFKGIFSTF